MGVLDKFEKGVERVVSGAFAKAFRSDVKIVDLASAIRRQLDDRTAIVSHERNIAPNKFMIELAPADEEQVNSWGREAMADELIAVATDHATRQRYTFVGPVSVDFESNNELENGRFQVRSETVKGSTAPATSSAARHPIIDVDGHRYLLTGQKTVLGRGSEADIVVNDTGVSRRHLEFRITPERRVIATDLNSTNGTFVEGHPVDAATLVNGNTITIGRTTILFWAAEESDDTGSLD
ncbi:MAG TPA: DUF3662 and FHA domain-containing protein [Actinomycetales bacterium]|nr:DUF3662 and FHA domain-containing protein [Actinomycetales bacterium]